MYDVSAQTNLTVHRYLQEEDFKYFPKMSAYIFFKLMCKTKSGSIQEKPGV